MHYLENGKVYCLQLNYEEGVADYILLVVQEHQLILLDLVGDLEEAAVSQGLVVFKLVVTVVL